MATPKRDIRDLQNIRTLSGGVNQTSIPYKAYMKLSCIEREKIRRGTERKSASKRIVDIDARLHQIEAEKTALLKILDEQHSHAPFEEPPPGIEPKAGTCRSAGRFKFRY